MFPSLVQSGALRLGIGRLINPRTFSSAGASRQDVKHEQPKEEPKSEPSAEPKVEEPAGSAHPEEPAVTTKVSFWTRGRVFLASTVLVAGGFAAGSLIKGDNPLDVLRDTKKNFERWADETFAEPSRPNLLPDILPESSGAPQYTLVINLGDTVLHTEWDRRNGYRYLKRPGLDYFLQYMSQFYEIVIFSNEIGGVILPVIEKLDPNQYSSYRLFRDAAKYKHATYIKDLSRLNRRLDRVVVLDHNAKQVQQPENRVPISKWDGTNRSDSALLDLIPFLESLVRENVPDVRTVIQSTITEPDFPTGVAQRLRLRHEHDTRLQQKLTSTGLYHPVQQQAPYIPPSVAAIPSDVLQQVHKQTPRSVLAMGGAEAEEADSKPEKPTVWARLRARNAEREREEMQAAMRLQRELKELEQIKHAQRDA